jgi:hypothetical protein
MARVRMKKVRLCEASLNGDAEAREALG